MLTVSARDAEWIAEVQLLFESIEFVDLERHSQVLERTPIGFADEDRLGPAVLYAFLVHGAQGLDAIYKTSTSELDLKFTAQRALVAIAIRDASCLRFIRWAERFIDAAHVETVAKKASGILNDDLISSHARSLLRKLIRFNLADPRERSSVAYLWSMTDELDNTSEAEILVSDIIAKSVLNVSDELCDQLQRLLETDSKERAYQLFLQDHPAILDPLASAVYPLQRLGSDYATDFVIRRLDNQYTLVELEKPRDRLFTEYPQPSGPLSHAIAQVLKWFALIEDHPGYIREHGLPEIRSPRAIVIIGRSAQLNIEQRRMLSQINGLFHPKIEILTFDGVVARARELVRNLTEHPNVSAARAFSGKRERRARGKRVQV